MWYILATAAAASAATLLLPTLLLCPIGGVFMLLVKTHQCSRGVASAAVSSSQSKHSCPVSKNIKEIDSRPAQLAVRLALQQQRSPHRSRVRRTARHRGQLPNLASQPAQLRVRLLGAASSANLQT